MSRNRLLVVEDDPSQRLVIQSILETECSLEIVGSIEVAKERILTQTFDFFLLDIMLEDGSGIELAQFIRSLKNHKITPIIFLTSRQDISTKVQGFELGADDYIVKPVDPQELKVRVRSRLKRHKDLAASSESLQVGDLLFDLGTQRISSIATSTQPSVEMNLTPIEFKLLLYLARNQGSPLTREEILQHVWGKTTHVMDRSVDTYVATLRKKLGDRGSYIKSVHGVGYRFQPPEPLKNAA